MFNLQSNNVTIFSFKSYGKWILGGERHTNHTSLIVIDKAGSGKTRNDGNGNGNVNVSVQWQ